MQIKSPIFAVATMMLMSACGSSNDTPSNTTPLPPSQSAIAAEYHGNWQASGYALSMKITEDSVNVYRYTTDYCLHISQEEDVNTQELERFVRQTDTIQQLEWYSGFGTSDFSVPGIHFEKSVTQPASCQEGVISMLDDSNSEMEPLELWAFYSQIFTEYYVDFALKDVDWTQVINNSGENLHSDSNALSVFSAMAQTLETLSDGHNYVQVNERGWAAKTLTKPTLTERLVQEFAEEHDIPFPIPEELITPGVVDEINAFVIAHLENQWEIVTDYAPEVTDVHTAAGGLIRWFENQGIGYLYIGGMTGYADAADFDETGYAEQTLNVVNAALELALSDLSHTNGLIIDVRNNDGGHDFVSLAIANRFTDSVVHAYSKQARDGNSRTPLQEVYLQPHNGIRYTGPTVLLTSSSTVSAAEVFTLSMAQLPQVTLVGEPSHGAFSNVMEWRLPSGFSIGLSNEYYLSPEGEWFESLGVPVDIAVPFYSPEQREPEVDLGIETAIAIFNQ